MADGEALIGQTEEDFDRGDEPGKADRVHGSAFHLSAPSLPRAERVRDRMAEMRLADLGKTRHELARCPRGRVGLGSLAVVDDLPVRDLPGRELRETLEEDRRDREVARGED